MKENEEPIVTENEEPIVTENEAASMEKEKEDNTMDSEETNSEIPASQPERCSGNIETGTWHTERDSGNKLKLTLRKNQCQDFGKLSTSVSSDDESGKCIKKLKSN